MNKIIQIIIGFLLLVPALTASAGNPSPGKPQIPVTFETVAVEKSTEDSMTLRLRAVSKDKAERITVRFRDENVIDARERVLEKMSDGRFSEFDIRIDLRDRVTRLPALVTVHKPDGGQYSGIVMILVPTTKQGKLTLRDSAVSPTDGSTDEESDQVKSLPASQAIKRH